MDEVLAGSNWTVIFVALLSSSVLTVVFQWIRDRRKDRVQVEAASVTALRETLEFLRNENTSMQETVLRLRAENVAMQRKIEELEKLLRELK